MWTLGRRCCRGIEKGRPKSGEALKLLYDRNRFQVKLPTRMKNSNAAGQGVFDLKPKGLPVPPSGRRAGFFAKGVGSAAVRSWQPQRHMQAGLRQGSGMAFSSIAATIRGPLCSPAQGAPAFVQGGSFAARLNTTDTIPAAYRGGMSKCSGHCCA